MGNNRKYHSKEEKRKALAEASARYYAKNKEIKHKTDLLNYYRKRAASLMVLHSASLSPSSSFQLSAFN